MLKNLKHSILFILIVILLLLVVVISLAASRPVSIDTATVSAQKENNLKYSKWSGLGMGLFSTNDTSTFNGYVDTLIANGFTSLRIDIPDYQNTEWLARSKAAVISAIAKGANVIWGVSSNGFNNVDYTITTENWPAYRQAILDAATWAQANGVYEFQLGNEEEMHIGNISEGTLQANLKAVATEVQAIFTRGNISYTSSGNYYMGQWHTLGRGDIDILAWNVYSNQDNWQTAITNMVSWWGADHAYITEFNLSYVSLDSYSADESVQAAGITSMIDYIKASGITRAHYFCYNPNVTYGALKATDTYRLLWNSLTSSNAILDTTAPDTTGLTNDTTITTPATTAPNTTGQSNNAAPTYSNTPVSVVTNTTLQEKEPVKAFTTRFYKLCLSRDPDSAGLNGWVNGLETGALTGADVAYGFLFSDEFIKRNVSNEEYIKILYRAFFNREPDSGGYSGWLDYLNTGASRKAVLDGFINSQEFKNLCAAYGIKPGSI